MPLEIRNKKDGSVLFSNDYVAGDFNVDKLSEDNMVLNLPFATAEMRQWYFTGIRLAYSRWKYEKSIETEWKGALEVVTIYFNLNGSCSIQLKGTQAPIKFENQQCNLFYSNGGNAIVKNEDLLTSVFMVQFTREAFIRLTKDTNTVLAKFSGEVAEARQVTISHLNRPVNLDMNLIINSILQCNYSIELKKMFLLSKTIELLVLVAKTFEEVSNEKDRFIKNEYDKQRITFVKEVLLKNIQSPPTLPQLATMAGINEFKLKKGFKEMFGKSVFGFLSDLRLYSAKHQLTEKKKTVSEISFELGYSSVQHFSAAFKKKFKVSPRNL